MKDRNSFVFYKDWHEVIADYEPLQQLEIYNAIVSLAFYDEDIEVSDAVKGVVKFIKKQIIRDKDKWAEVCRKRSENGRLGGLAKQENLANASKCNQKQANDSKSRQMVASVADNDNVNDNVNDNDNVILESKDSMSINKENIEGKPSIKKVGDIAWRKDRNVYTSLVDEAERELIIDYHSKEEFKRIFPNGDYEKTIMRTADFWRTDKGYEYKLKGRSRTLNMKSTIKNNWDKNVVYIGQQQQQSQQGEKKFNFKPNVVIIDGEEWQI